MYRLSLGVTTKMSIGTTDWISRNAEALGADGVWIGEDIGKGQDTSVLAASMILHSRNVRIGTGIIPIATNHVTYIARSSLTLQEIANGRFVLGIGVGGIQDLNRAGIRLRRPVTELAEVAKCLRTMWQGGRVTIKTEILDLRGYSLRLDSEIQIPIFFGVRGPQMLDLAGRVSDGVILSGPYDYLERAISIIHKAASEVKRNPSDIEVVVWAPTIPTFRGINDKTARRIVALVVADTPESMATTLNMDQERIAAVRNAVVEGGPNAGAKFVDDELLDAFSISGSLEHMVDRFEALNEIGVSEVVLGPPYSGNWKRSLADLINEARGRSR